jgi:peptidoglycan/xylan/chitin deacetylase (PgdA/CDA1 family)
MYHGVVAETGDPLLDTYAIDVASFRAHIEFFSRTRRVVPLGTLVERLQSGGSVPSEWIAITLDDAFSNQVTTAASILAEVGAPWALAVPAGLVGTGRSIWTCEFRFLLLECWPWPSVPSPSETLEELPTRSVTERRDAVRSLLPQLFQMRDDLRITYLDRLIDRVGADDFRARLSRDARFALTTWPEIEKIRDAGVELLSHGWFHRPQNATIRPEALREEIVHSREVMRERLGRAPDGIALPHGQKSSATDDLVADAGYRFCLTSLPRRVTGSVNRLSLPRFASEYPLPVLRRHLLSP